MILTAVAVGAVFVITTPPLTTGKPGEAPVKAIGVTSNVIVVPASAGTTV